jgi:adenylate cyclase class 2
MLAALDFQLVREVRKCRQGFLIPWQDQEIEGALDEVHGLGSFVELELLADDATLETAKAAIASLAGHLGLSRAERRSYLELLLG